MVFGFRAWDRVLGLEVKGSGFGACSAEEIAASECSILADPQPSSLNLQA